ncbi:MULTISPECIES: hypothetical protein [unclassified Stenotrophomonas]|uniref:hypothetical protein n=1 Tax=unclassified Stenotrophomonas TaxID=196198 RepID=UPI0025EFF799|nr:MULTISPECIES: hypothetical protein [unclassified Stenotrophomonas]
MTAPLLGFDNPRFHTGRNTSVRRGARWHGVAQACIELADGRQLGPLALQTELRGFEALEEADLRDEHDPACRTPAGLLQVMQQLYPGFRSDELVTLVHFWME